MTATTEGTRQSSRDDEVDHPPFQPALPRVNLLPASVPEGFTLRRIRRNFIGIAVLMALVFGVVWYLQGNHIGEAEARLAQANAENATATARVEALAPIKLMYAQITNEQSLVATTLASEPQAALAIARLVGSGDVTFTSIAIEYRGIPEPGAELNPCPNPDPFATDITIGCVTFSGTAGTRDEVSAMLNTMAADPLFIGPYVSNSTVTEATTDAPSGVMFTGSAGVSVDALQKSLTDEQLQAILSPPAADDDAAAAAEEQAP